MRRLKYVRVVSQVFIGPPSLLPEGKVTIPRISAFKGVCAIPSDPVYITWNYIKKNPLFLMVAKQVFFIKEAFFDQTFFACGAYNSTIV